MDRQPASIDGPPAGFTLQVMTRVRQGIGVRLHFRMWGTGVFIGHRGIWENLHGHGSSSFQFHRSSMASSILSQTAFSAAPRAQAARTSGEFSRLLSAESLFSLSYRAQILPSVSYNAGSFSTDLQGVASESCYQCRSKGLPLIRAAASKQKKKVKDKKKSSSSWADKKQWKFDEMMLIWDDVFMKACETSSIATALYELSRNGLSQYGRGCILMHETVTTRSGGSASGFTFKSRYTSSDELELPSYSSGEWVAEYVPKEFILDPSKAPILSSETPPTSVEDGKVRVVDQGKLISVLRGMERTRLLGLLAGPESEDLNDPGKMDAGGEKPYDPAKDELVIALLVLVDGQQAVGADVLKAYPTVEDGASSNAASFWTLALRDEIPV